MSTYDDPDDLHESADEQLARLRAENAELRSTLAEVGPRPRTPEEDQALVGKINATSSPEELQHLLYNEGLVYMDGQ